MSEQQADYLIDANAMLGKGYEHNLPPADVFGKMSGYTPTPDILCKKYGFVTALVWGRMWRYCQGYDRVCRAKLETIAESLGMSERTIIRHIETLIQGGYFIDKTPGLKNRPHIYADTGKLRLAFSTEVIDTGVTESQRTMTESQRQGDRESHEDTIKETNKDIDPIAQKLIDVKCRFDPNSRVIIQAWKDAFPDEIILRAIDDAVARGKASIPYIDRIIISWQAGGVPKSRDEQIAAAKRQPQPEQRRGPAIRSLD